MTAAAPVPHQDEPKGSPRNTWTFSVREMMTATAAYPERSRDAVRWLHTHAMERGLSMKETAGAIGYDVTVLSRVMRGKYGVDGLPGNLGKVAEAIEALRQRITEQGNVRKVPFVMTPTAKKIHQACDFARVYNLCAIIMGDTQKGKTMALRAYAAEHQPVRYFSVPDAATRRDVVVALLRSMGGAYKSKAGELKMRLADCFDEHMALIVDEVHQAWLTRDGVKEARRTMEMFRWLYDTTGVQIIFSGTRVFGDRIANDAVLEQLKQRAPMELVLPNKTPLGDAWAIAGHFNLTRPAPASDTYAEIRHIVQGTGLRRFTTYLQAAQVSADKGKQPVTWDHFLNAYANFQRLTQGE